ncbi:MAG: hypothetical protein A2741_01670 [Candidatus Zambryskibacteria bacterium RIFCSPHIGHO2_01_FULL_43_27]|uniref:Uncharacterized protein n=1 Tax=Candidatus Zambryskibacteria bacterium RIFCSPLOWO2_01_FULL_43_17 TaxID=1802760 RepID=A0A1G2U262_9BACT|nr:MAG: hypothetical protein A2741_01670 [Candidatus Zambryskibacteria bacterium RIFCSPHIGHO2_01_FULL_43_27]OHB00692.1 MAG: hypothetical protein A3E93_03010 [Candidatus Zambryskibacteria bacterium RIFCSPHIGHO2_12_FULL_43_12b]OHB02990.1 MAG: hypothetical protein A2920_02875 [Candidatus Zambryskibacteria bacterium RIFCSPLOWO2_01_FULL_43_17]
MLQLPKPEVGLNASCHISAANSLLALVSGLAALRESNFDTTGVARTKFIKVMLDYYPWSQQPPYGTTKEVAAEDLYDNFRNPLSHALGLRTRGNFVINIGRVGVPSSQYLERISNSDTSPGIALTYRDVEFKGEGIKEKTLDVVNFYWGVRQMVSELTSDSQEVTKIENALETHGV